MMRSKPSHFCHLFLVSTYSRVSNFVKKGMHKNNNKYSFKRTLIFCRMYMLHDLPTYFSAKHFLAPDIFFFTLRKKYFLFDRNVSKLGPKRRQKI